MPLHASGLALCVLAEYMKLTCDSSSFPFFLFCLYPGFGPLFFASDLTSGILPSKPVDFSDAVVLGGDVDGSI